MNNKALKENKVNEICDLYAKFDYVFLFQYTGMNASKIWNLRSSLFKKTAERVTVVKNSLHSIALSKLGISCLTNEDFVGQNALIFTNNPLSVASLLKGLSDSKSIKVVSFHDKSTRFENKEFALMSSYENETALKSQLVSLLSNAYSSVVRVINEKSSII